MKLSSTMSNFAKLSKAGLEEWPFVEPSTIEPLSFEKFDALSWRLWMAKWWPLSILLSLTYVSLILLGQRAMRNKAPFQLKGVLMMWNWTLALFSLAGFSRTVVELYQVLSGPDGLHRSICVRDTLNQSSMFWAFLFTWSKLLELGDTAFLVLRKKPVIFLHWYHHVTVLVFSWATYPDYEPILRWFGVVNMLVHSIMYSYFALKVMNFRLWHGISISVTTLQVSQMVMGVSVNCYAILMKRQGIPCARSDRGLNIHLIMYGSYLILFAHYFYKSYISKKGRKFKAV